MQKTLKMTPKWRLESIKKHKKQYKKTPRKMMQKQSAKKLFAWRGPWAWSAGRVPLETPSQGSLLHPTSSNKQTSGKQLQSKTLEPQAVI